MSKLNVDQKTVKDLFQDKKSDFLIPDYQRPYAWGETECQTLWEDIFTFAFPDDDYSRFDSENDEYFLGPIVTFKNEDKKLEIIDGQQRLTTLMLLLRAFYSKYDNMRDENSKSTREQIERCIWKTDEFDKPKMSELKIDSEVATDIDKEEFLEILRNGVSKSGNNSNYAKNYRFFQNKISEFLSKYPSYFSYLPMRILNNCILLPIEADNQDTALRIFSTLNDRGKPLSDADIFKAQLYKYYKSIGEKDEFINKWKNLEELCNKLFANALGGTPMDELFSRYMYFERANQGISSSTTEALRKFYEKESYKLLKNPSTLENLIDLADFWNDVAIQDDERFSDKVLRQLYVLNYAPNSMWTYFISVYYLKNRNDDGKLDDDKFNSFLSKTIAFVWTYAIVNPGVNALRSPIYAEMINIVTEQQVNFERYKFDEFTVRNLFNTYTFSNIRPLTKSMLVWWMFQKPNQQLISLDTSIEIEHIYARNRQKNEKALMDAKKLEQIGNKAILEKRINIRASDYRFSDKKKYYEGFTNDRNQVKEGTKNAELIELSNSHEDFVEKDIEIRNKDILDCFISFLRQNNLLQE